MFKVQAFVVLDIKTDLVQKVLSSVYCLRVCPPVGKSPVVHLWRLLLQNAIV